MRRLPAGELRVAIRYHLLFGLVVTMLLLGRAGRDGIYLSRAGVADLPWLYAIVSLVSVGSVALYVAWFAGAPRSWAPWVQLGLAAMVAVVTLAVEAGAGWSYPLLYVLVEILTVLTIVQFWNVVNTEFDPRRAKRLYGLITAGQAGANLLCGLLAGGAGRLYPVETLLWLVVLGTAGTGLLYRRWAPPATGVTTAPRRAGASRRTRRPRLSWEGYRSYLVLIAVVVACGYLAAGWVDFQFKVTARASFDEAAMVRFFGAFYGTVGVVALVIQLLLLPRLLAWIGNFVLLALMPFGFVVGGVLLSLWPGLAVATALKFTENGLRYSVYDPLLQILYLPLPEELRVRVQSIASGMIKPAAIGLAGLILVPFAPGTSAGVPIERLGWPIAISAAMVLVALAGVRTGYLRSLVRDRTACRRFRRVTVTPELLPLLARLVEVGRPELLAWLVDHIEGDAETAHRLWCSATTRPELPATVRARLVWRLGIAAEELADPFVRAVAAARRGRWRELLVYLQDPDPERRQAALTILAEVATPEAHLAVREALQLSARTLALGEAAVAIELLTPSERRALLERAVRESAAETPALLEALVQAPEPACAEALVAAATHPAWRSPAARALAALGRVGWSALRATHPRPWRLLDESWGVYTRRCLPELREELVTVIMADEPDPRYWPYPLLAGASGPPGLLETAAAAARAWYAEATRWSSYAESEGGNRTAARLVGLAANFRGDAATATAVAWTLRRWPPPVERWEHLLAIDRWRERSERARIAELVEQCVPKPEARVLLALLERPESDNVVATPPWEHCGPPWSRLLAACDPEREEDSEMTEPWLERLLFLADVPLFADLPGEVLAELAEAVDELVFDAGQRLIARGEPGDSLYILLAGRLEVRIDDKRLAELEPGAVVGEMALLDDQPRSADVYALERSRLLRLDRADFSRLLEAYPSIARAVMRVLVQRLRTANLRS